LKADVLWVSTRAFQQAFGSYAGIYAHQYLLARKLHLARRHLARTPWFRPPVTGAACSARRRAKPWRTTARLSDAADWSRRVEAATSAPEFSGPHLLFVWFLGN
jgi:AraC-like DNA-binding protein